MTPTFKLASKKTVNFSMSSHHHHLINQQWRGFGHWLYTAYSNMYKPDVADQGGK